MKPDELFQNLDPEQVHERVAAAWTFERGWIPVPRFQVHCPQCRSVLIQLSRVGFGQRKGSATKYRCDVSFKCTSCSMFWTHGIPITKAVYNNAGGSEVWSWREIRAALGE